MVRKRAVEGRRRIDRLAETLAVGAQVADVVQVVVGNQDGAEGVQAQPVPIQNLLEPADAHPRVDQQAVFFGTQVIRIAAAAAGQAHEPDHGRSSSQYLPMTP